MSIRSLSQSTTSGLLGGSGASRREIVKIFNFRIAHKTIKSLTERIFSDNVDITGQGLGLAVSVDSFDAEFVLLAGHKFANNSTAVRTGSNLNRIFDT